MGAGQGGRLGPDQPGAFLEFLTPLPRTRLHPHLLPSTFNVDPGSAAWGKAWTHSGFDVPLPPAFVGPIHSSFKKIFIYLFGCIWSYLRQAGSLLQRVGFSLVVARGL